MPPIDLLRRLVTRHHYKTGLAPPAPPGCRGWQYEVVTVRKLGGATIARQSENEAQFVGGPSRLGAARSAGFGRRPSLVLVSILMPAIVFQYTGDDLGRGGGVGAAEEAAV